MTEQDRKIKRLNGNRLFMIICLMTVGIFMLVGCDSGEKAVDKVTGNEAVKQYHKLKKDMDKIAEQQAEKYNDILDADKKGE